jgi:chromosome partitioning protein
MHTIVVATLKGGTGKTTTALALAAEFASRGRTVALVDGDPQASATMSLRLAPAREPWTEAPVPLQLTGLEDEALWIARGGRPLAVATREQAHAFFRRDFAAEGVQLRIIDTAPGAVGLLAEACRVASLVVVPVDTGPFGIGGMVDVVGLVKQLGADAPPVRVVLTRTHARRNLTGQVRKQVSVRIPNALCSAEIPEDVRCAEAPASGLPVTLYAPKSRASAAYAALATELETALPGLAAPLMREAAVLTAGAELEGVLA